MPPKRKAPSAPTATAVEAKKPKREAAPHGGGAAGPDADLRAPHPLAAVAEEHGIVLRQYYPAEMSNARAAAYAAGALARPAEELARALEETAAARPAVGEAGAAVVHWFRADLRTRDNRALWLAGERARAAGVPLVGLYVLSPQDLEAHLAAPVRVDFALRSLRVLRADLAALGVPLVVETVAARRDVPARVLARLAGWGARHLFANAEYEVDELRRDARLVRLGAARGVAVDVVHDTCVVPPGALQTGAGRQYAAYTPWFRAWVAHLHANPELLEPFAAPAVVPDAVRARVAHLFAAAANDDAIPAAPEGKRLTDEEAARYGALWPAGERAALDRLAKFAEERISRYHERRNFPAEAGTSSLSVHLAAGTLSARTAVRYARDRNKTKKLDAGIEGIRVWISELAWRDFYRHVLVHWPYICMNKPFKPEYSNIAWSYDAAHFAAWQAGRTGYPLVDAAMRQVQATGWMHNRLRMVCASFLVKDLLLDWRLGERWFMEHLVDGDFASNSGGWGFSASVGVDPQPYFRVFNPILQSEKFDPDGVFIRKWLPELRAVPPGRAIHDPYGRGAAGVAQKAGYPRMIVDHKASRDHTLRAYKEGLGRADAAA